MADALLGPSGGNGGHEFAGYTVPAGAQVRAVRVVAGWFINAIQLIYSDGSGAAVELNKIGGHGFSGGQEHTFTLEPGEYLTGISGRFGGYVDSLRFHTNQRVSDTFGGSGGDESFEYVAAAGSEVVGFFGRADWHIDKLGVVVRERAGAAPAVAGKAVASKAPAAKATPGKAAAAAEPVAVAAEPIAPVAPKTPKKTATVVAAAAPVAEPAAKPAKPAKAASKQSAAAPVAAEGQPEVAPPTAPKVAAEPATPVLPAVPAPTKVAPEADAPAQEEGQPAIKPPAAARAAKGAGKTRPGGTDLAVPAATPDDLIKIEGIGPKIAQVLADNGITTFQALADASPEHLRTLLVAAGNRYRIADPTTWPEQAALAARGDWGAFDALVARLKAGRTV